MFKCDCSSQLVADYLSSTVAGTIWNRSRAEFAHATTTVDSIDSMLKSEIVGVDRRMIADALPSEVLYTGSTLVGALVHNGVVHVSNVGDSRAIYMDPQGTAHQISVDHKPNAPAELQRIQQAGGRVEFVGVWRVQGMLATSRAMGDGRWCFLQTFFACSDPQNKRHPRRHARRVPAGLRCAAQGRGERQGGHRLRDPGDGRCVGCVRQSRCGGYCEEVGEFACFCATKLFRNGHDYEQAAREIVATALENGSPDNVSVLIMKQSVFSK